MVVVIEHGVVVGRLPAARATKTLRLGVCPHVHMRGIDPGEPRLAGRVLAANEVLRRLDELIVTRLHPLSGERTCVFDALFADVPPARLLGRVVLLASPAVQHAAGSEAVPKMGKVRRWWIVGELGLFFGVQVLQVAEEFVEAMDGR